MPSQRERIHKEFLATPAAQREDFCRRLFLLHLQAEGDPRSLQDRMAHLLTSLEQAIADDAKRPDLWHAFLTWLHEEMKPLQEQQDKLNQEKVRNRKS